MLTSLGLVTQENYPQGTGCATSLWGCSKCYKVPHRLLWDAGLCYLITHVGAVLSRVVGRVMLCSSLGWSHMPLCDTGCGTVKSGRKSDISLLPGVVVHAFAQHVTW
jgi:hypothetical protein